MVSGWVGKMKWAMGKGSGVRGMLPVKWGEGRVGEEEVGERRWSDGWSFGKGSRGFRGRKGKIDFFIFGPQIFEGLWTNTIPKRCLAEVGPILESSNE